VEYVHDRSQNAWRRFRPIDSKFSAQLSNAPLHSPICHALSRTPIEQGWGALHVFIPMTLGYDFAACLAPCAVHAVLSKRSIRRQFFLPSFSILALPLAMAICGFEGHAQRLLIQEAANGLKRDRYPKQSGWPARAQSSSGRNQHSQSCLIHSDRSHSI
jgi:hypothetical protein